MSLKIKQIIKDFFYIATLSLFFLLIVIYYNTKTFSSKENNIQNNISYKKIQIKPLLQSGVAVSTYIGEGKIEGFKTTENGKIIVNNNLNLKDYYLNQEKINNIIKENLIFIKEYYNLLNSNIYGSIKNSKNRKKTLESILNQLRIRYKNANYNVNFLKKQQNILLQEYEKLNTLIYQSKKQLKLYFYKTNPDKFTKAINNYLNTKEKQVKIKANIIFINVFIKKYIALNKYNYNLIDILTLNKKAIINNSYVVIPKQGTNILKNFDLIYTEEEFKQKRK